MIFEFYEQNLEKYVEKVYLKLNLTQSTKQESPAEADVRGIIRRAEGVPSEDIF